MRELLGRLAHDLLLRIRVMPDLWNDADVLARDIDHRLRAQVHIRGIGDEYQSTEVGWSKTVPGSDGGAPTEDLVNTDRGGSAALAGHSAASRTKVEPDHVAYEMCAVI